MGYRSFRLALVKVTHQRFGDILLAECSIAPLLPKADQLEANEMPLNEG